MARRPKKKRSPVIDWLQFLALRLVVMAVHMIPVGIVLRLARIWGRVAYHVIRKKAHHARRNLRIAYGHEWREERIERVAVEGFEHLAMLAAEVMFTPRLITPLTWRRYVDFDETVGPVVRLLLERKSAVIMLSAHYGNWEVLGYVLATLGFSNDSIARPIDNKYVNELLMGARERTGQRLIDKRGATEAVRRVVADKGILCVLGDPSGGRKGTFVRFFGVHSSCHKTIGLLALNERLPIVIGYSRRIGMDFRFRMTCVDIIRPEEYDGVDRITALERITQRFTAGIEEMIRRDPAQYMWVYRRFKSRSSAELAVCDDRWRDREDDILAGVAG
jgi:KDO2-lipid IV(A) lauroyltransferase